MTGQPGVIKRSRLERRKQLEGKIAKLKALGGSPNPNEAATALRIAAELGKELEGLPTPRQPKMVRETVPIVHGGAGTGVYHRYFQAAEFAARWSGMLLHVSYELLVYPRGYLYGPRRHFSEARKRFDSVKEKLDSRLQAWVDQQGVRVTEKACDEYTRSFLLGLGQYLESQEPAAAKLVRVARYEEVKKAYQAEYREL
jgi:hypothetical protein